MISIMLTHYSDDEIQALYRALKEGYEMFQTRYCDCNCDRCNVRCVCADLTHAYRYISDKYEKSLVTS